MSSGFLFLLTSILLISNFYKSFAAIEVYGIHCSGRKTNSKIKIFSFNGDDSECEYHYDSKFFQFNDRRQLKCEGNGKGKCGWSDEAKDCGNRVNKENTLVVTDFTDINGGKYIENSLIIDDKLTGGCCNNKLSDIKCKQTYEYCFDAPAFNTNECFNKIYYESYYKTGDATESIFKNYIGIYDQFNEYSFIEANAYCNDRFNTDLASIHNKIEEDEIKLLFLGYNDIYIGLNDINREDSWRWKDNTNIDYIEELNWADNEPNNNGRHGEDCGVIGNFGKIYDTDCTIKRNRFICNAPSSRRRRIKESNNLIQRLS